MKRIISFLLTVCMLAALCACPMAAEKGSFDHFQKINSVSSLPFSDVSGWYKEHVAHAYALDLMKGSTDNNGQRCFYPDENISLAETVTLASRIHSTYYYNGYEFVQGHPWYQTYIDYAVEHDILSSTDEYTDYTQSATRAQFASILSHALPDEGYRAINTIETGAIPDVDMAQDYSFGVYKLYRAGVLTGSRLGAFQPDQLIKRSEVAAVVSRMVALDMRVSFELYAPLFVGFTPDPKNTGNVSITGLTMTTENSTCYLTMNFKSQQSRFLSVMDDSGTLYILEVATIEPGIDSVTFTFPMAALQEIYTSSSNPAGEKLIMEFYSGGNPDSVTDLFHISINQFSKYFER